MRATREEAPEREVGRNTVIWTWRQPVFPTDRVRTVSVKQGLTDTNTKRRSTISFCWVASAEETFVTTLTLAASVRGVARVIHRGGKFRRRRRCGRRA